MGTRKDYPKTYLHFEGKPDENGNRRKFWIQDLTKEYVEKVLDDFTADYLRDEILFGYSEAYKSPRMCNYFTTLQAQVFSKKMSLICLTKNDNGDVQVAGLNSLYLCKKGENFLVKCGDWAKKMKALMLINYITGKKDPFRELGITEYVKSMGLYVVSEFRNCGVGQNLLNSREFLCKNLGVKASITLFSSKISQKLAERAGFKDLSIVNYEEVPHYLRIPKLHENTKQGRYMYIFYL